MKIDLYASSGSPIGLIPADITGRGVGGAELAMMTWAETMAGRGHDIRIYNDPRQPGGYDGVIYLNKSEYAPREARDALIVFRTPMTELRATQAGIKIFWSCDQFTSGDFSRDIFPYVDRAVCISPHHVDYHRTYYHVEDSKIGHIDLGVRLAEYRQDYEKIAGRCIFCSVPDRGLNVLRVIWPQIKERMPGASLVITADYRLWGAANAGNHQHRLEWLSLPDVTFLGAIPREQLVKEQLRAEVMTYPCTYEELFCISAAECQVAGALPVTTETGALATTNQWGQIIEGSPLGAEWQRQFVDAACATMDMADPDRQQRQAQAARRFDWEAICGRWETLIETGEFK